MKPFIIIFSCIALLSLSFGSLAAPTTPAPQSQAFEYKTFYCPAPNKLQKTGLIWKAPGGWISYSESFVDHITQFIGAQWIGVEVGKIICLYRGDKEFTFPVALEQNDLLIEKPVVKPGSFWRQLDKTGYMECRSADINNCDFVVKVYKPIENVYDQLNFK